MPKLIKSLHSYVVNQATKVDRFTAFETNCVDYDPKTKSKLNRGSVLGKILVHEKEGYGYVIYFDNCRMIV